LPEMFRDAFEMATKAAEYKPGAAIRPGTPIS
jgi:hypothetical protein